MTASEITIPASTIASLLGCSLQAAHKRAAGCPFVWANGKGRRRKEFLLSGLPGDIQNLYIKRYAELTAAAAMDGEKNLPAVRPGGDVVRLDRLAEVPAEAEEAAANEFLRLPQTCQDAGFKLLGIVNHARDVHARAKKGKVKALKAYAARIEMPYPTLRRHMKKADDARAAAEKSGGDIIQAQLAAIAPKYGRSKNTVRSFDEDAIRFAWNLYCSQKHLNLSDVYKDVVNTAGIHGWRVGSEDSLRRTIRMIDDASRTRARKGQKKFEADKLVKILRNYKEIWPNFMWCGDHHIFDVFVKIPDGNGGWNFRRPWVTAWMDMRSRSFVGWCVCLSPNSKTIAMALAHGISEKNDPSFPQHGLPDSVYVDNGKDYRAKYLNGETIEIGKIDYPEIIEKYAALGINPFYIDLEYDPGEAAWVKKRGKKEISVNKVKVGGVYAALGIGSRFATAYHPWAKPIERAFRTVVQQFSRRLPGWCGSGHEQRPEKLTFELKRGTVLTLPEFCDAWYDWVVNHYHKQPHRGHGMGGMSPDQVFTSLMPRPVKVAPALLDFSLMKQEKVKIHSWGFNLHRRKFGLDLPVNLHGGFLANRIIGQWAQIRFDADFKTVRVYVDGEYICDGKPLDRASFLDPDDPAMINGLKMQGYQTQASTHVLRVIQDHPAAAADVSDAEAVRLLSQESAGDGEDIAAPDSALRATTGKGSRSHPAPDVVQQIEAPAPEKTEIIPINRDERYRMLLHKDVQGGELSEKDRVFMAEFEAGAEYAASKNLYEAEREYAEYQHKKGVAV